MKELKKTTWFFCKTCAKSVLGFLTAMRFDFLFGKIIYEYYCDHCHRFTTEEFEEKEK